MFLALASTDLVQSLAGLAATLAMTLAAACQLALEGCITLALRWPQSGG